MQDVFEMYDLFPFRWEIVTHFWTVFQIYMILFCMLLLIAVLSPLLAFELVHLLYCWFISSIKYSIFKSRYKIQMVLKLNYESSPLFNLQYDFRS